MTDISRKDFVKLTVVFGAAVAGLDCSGNKSGSNDAAIDSRPTDAGVDARADAGSSVDAGPADAPPLCSADKMLGNAEISANHGHAVTIPGADMLGTADKTYSIMGASPHDHMITLTSANFATLRGGGTVMTTSTTDLSHSHVCTVKC